MTTPLRSAGSGEFTLFRDGLTIALVGSPASAVDREYLRTTVEQLLVVGEAGVSIDRVVLDLRDAGYLDIQANYLLLGLARRCYETGRSLQLRCVVAETFDALFKTGILARLQAYGATVDTERDA